MALLFPDTPAAVRLNGGYFRELDVLDRLRLSLPEGYEIFHGVDWHSVHHGSDHHGEIDLVIMNRAGELLLVEVKAGQVTFGAGGIVKDYGHHTKLVDQQIRLQRNAMMSRLDHAGIRTQVNNCLVLPDCKILQGEIISIPRERIFDAGDYEHLGSLIQALIPQGAPQPLADQVRRFLSNHLKIAPDVSALQSQISATRRKLAHGLAAWVPRIEAPSNTFRIQATAGSGKTQLAMRLLEDAAARKLRALYVCFNRPLADRIAQLAPRQTQVGTFHELCIDHHLRGGHTPEVINGEVLQTAANAYVAAMADGQAHLDLLIIDEGQDFAPEWVESLAAQLYEDGRLYLLEDQDQRLYQHAGFDLSDAVRLRCHDNFRSPQNICHTINAFKLASHPIEARSPYPGEPPEFLVCTGSPQSMMKHTALAVQKLLDQGFAIGDIAVLSGHGAAHSAILRQDKLGPHRIRRYTGQYSKNGAPLWTDGELLVESVYRFKGQSAPAVIMTEIDFTELSAHERRKLFVGLTRAQMAAVLVLTQEAEAALAREIRN